MPHPVQDIELHCAHTLRQVRMHQASLVYVMHGHKDIWHRDRWQRLNAGDLLLLAAGTEWQLKNQPGALGCYRAQILTLSDAWLQAMHAHHPTYTNAPQVNTCASLPLRAWTQEAWTRLTDPSLSQASDALVQHRVMELLLLLAEAGHGFAHPQALSLGQKIHAMVTQTPDQTWSTARLSKHFHLSESTLLRRLKCENTTPADCVRNARLDLSLSLLQTTRASISEIARACGYGSHGHFSSAFALRFGLTPLQLRKRGNEKSMPKPHQPVLEHA